MPVLGAEGNIAAMVGAAKTTTATAAATITGDAGEAEGDTFDVHNLIAIGVIILALQCVFFVITWALHMEKMTDLAAGINFSTVAVVSFVLGESWYLRQLFVVAMVMIWGARLSGYLLFRTIKIGDGDRFDKSTWCIHFVGFWGFQSIWVLIVSLPVIFINSPWHYMHSINMTATPPPSLMDNGYIDYNNTNPRLQHSSGGEGGGEVLLNVTTPAATSLQEGGTTVEPWVVTPVPEFGTPWDVLGVIFWAVGVLLETFADMQKFYFKENPANQGRWCTFGLWSWSRHPNYFGEMLVWFGIFLVGASVYHRLQWTAALSPITVTGVLMFVSGIPLMERNADERYGKLEEYLTYKRNTSVLIPLPPRLYRKIPQALRVTVLLDIPLYSYTLQPPPEPDETTHIAPGRQPTRSQSGPEG